MGHILTMGHTVENGSHSKKWVILWKMGQFVKIMGPFLKNESHCEKIVTFLKMNQTFWKNESYCEKWVLLWKMDQTIGNESHSEKWVTLWKICHWKLGYILKNGSYCENGSHC